ncbi:MAG: methyl-accepting chemotaxis protein [Nitrospirae bacterium]|nr:MAG: methyl-accepting chemotaxis protein [Nitrospirota bacterium]
MFKNMKIGARLYALVALSAVLLIIVGGIGLNAASKANHGLHALYEENLTPLARFDRIIRCNLRNRIEIGQILLNPTAEEIKKRVPRIEENIENINKEWQAYMLVPQVPEEKKLAEKFAELRKEFRDKGLVPIIAALREGRIDEAKKINQEFISPFFPKLADATDALIKFMLDEAKEEFDDDTRTYVIARNVSIAAIVLGLALTFSFAWWIIGSITKPLHVGVNAMERIAQKDMTVSIESTSTDEVGQLMSSIKSMIGNLKQMIATIKTSADSVASASEQLSASSEQMSRGVAEQSGRSSQIATASEEMSQTVIDIAKNASEISGSANDTLGSAHDGEVVVNKTISEVQDIAKTVSDLSAVMVSLGDRSKQIGEIVGVIKDIADQTNLLALNAAIEAARAGEQGRGFAVVADEVRKLAERTAKATSEISDMIGAIQTEVEQALGSMEQASDKVMAGVDEASKAGAALNTIVGSIEGLKTMIHQIASATEEMSTVSETISKDIETIADVSKETSSSSEQIAQSASDLARLSSDLQRIVAGFKV